MSIDQKIDDIIELVKSGEGQDLGLYDELAPVYHYLYGTDYDYQGQLEYVKEKGPKHINRICDGGCGNGALTELLSEEFSDAEVVGVDINKDMIEDTRNRLGDRKNLSFVVEDLAEHKAKYDVYTVFAAIPNFDRDHLKKMFGRVHENLNENGLLVFDYKSPNVKKHENGQIGTWTAETDRYIIENPIMTIYKDGEPFYAFSFRFENKETGEEHYAGHMMPINLYTKEELIEILEAQGFTDIEVDEGVLDQSGVITAKK